MCFTAVILGGVLTTIVTPAYADAGVPMIFITFPSMLIALIPIIIIESIVMSRYLSLATGRSLKAASIGNIVSTVIGIPLTWLLLVILQLLTGGGSAYGLNGPFKKFLAITWQAPWLIPYESELYWMIPAATLILLVPFFFASWLIEYKVEKRLLSDIAADRVNRAVRDANLAVIKVSPVELLQ
ncbi:MAG: hypothetical protein HY036_10995 [Nitrospirae bacterium]|nr:hypothetical protein [Nitrospirota bacterium]